MCGFKFPWTHLEDKRLTSPHRNKFVGICGGGGGGGGRRNSILPWRLLHCPGCISGCSLSSQEKVLQLKCKCSGLSAFQH